MNADRLYILLHIEKPLAVLFTAQVSFQNFHPLRNILDCRIALKHDSPDALTSG